MKLHDGYSTGFEALEPRVMFDGAAAVFVVDAVTDAIEAPEDTSQDDHQELLYALGEPSLAAQASAIVFIDGSVEDIDAIVAEIGPDAEVYILDANEDGVDQIASVLDGRRNIAAIHIVSHGQSGALDLGSATMTAASMEGEHADDIAIIAASLSADADILIYGCDFAAGSRGQDAALLLSALTGADVAASSDLTGSTDLGGDWLLEEHVGDIDTASYIVEEYNHILWTTQVIAGGWFGDSPLNTPNGTLNAGSGLTSLGPMSGGAGIVMTNVTLPGTVTAFQIAGATGGTLATAATNNDWISADFVVGTEAIRISQVTFNQRTENPTAGQMAVRIVDVATNTVVMTSSTVNIDGSATNVVVPLTSLPVLQENGTYQIQFVFFNTTGTMFIDNPQIFTQINEAPVGIDDTIPVVVGQPHVIDVLENDTDVDLDPLFVSQINGGNLTVGTPVTLASGTTLTLQIDGTISVNKTSAASETFSYTLTDRQGHTATATATLTAAPSNYFDYDSDGVQDAGDIDDDNDGILDTTEGLNAPAQTGTWTISGNTATSAMSNGITVRVTKVSANAFANDTFSTAGAFWSGTQDGDASLSGNATFGDSFTVAFLDSLGNPVVVTDPILHLDRVGGIDGSLGNSAKFSLQGGLTWTEIAGTQDFRTNSTTAYDSGAGQATDPAWTAQSTLTDNTGTAAGSLRINGSVSSFTITAPQIGPLGAGGDGFEMIIQAAAPATDSEGDGFANYRDIDSDDDGILDNIEAQSTTSYIAPSGVSAGTTDANNDGLDDVYDAGALGAAGGIGLTPVNSDGTTTADYLDTDSDNDGASDRAENGLGVAQPAANATDTDGDGLKDVYETAIDGNVNDGFVVNEGISNLLSTPTAYLPDADGDAATGAPTTADLDFRDAVFSNDPPVIDLDVTPELLPGTGTVSSFTFGAPVTANNGQTETANGVGNGETALYQNVGTVNGQSVDMRATVVSTSGGGNPAFSAISGDANVQLGAFLSPSQTAVVRWELFVSGTTTPIVGDFSFLINDLDGYGGGTFERISVNTAGLDSYTVAGTTDISVSTPGANTVFDANDADPGTPGTTPGNSVRLNFSNTSALTITYQMNSTIGNIRLDGNTSTFFAAGAVTTDANPNYANTFTEGGPAVSIADSDMQITDDGSITQAVITLTNPQTLDQLNAPGVLPAGITVDPTSTPTSIILVGTATPDDYETAIKAITFKNTSSTPNTTVVRTINVTVTDDFNQTSNLAVASINVLDVPNVSPVLDNDADNSSGQTGANYETTYTENAPSISVVDADVSITDSDTATIEEATITLTNAFPLDSLQVGTMPLGISPLVDSSVPGVITVTLTGPASHDDFELALRAVRFMTTSENPDPTDRTITITVNDGSATSNIGTTTINVVPVNDNPTLDLDGNNSTAIAGNFATSYTENGISVSIADGDNFILDLDDSNIENAIIVLTNGQIGDRLTVGTLPAGISVVGLVPGNLTAAATVTIHLSGSASLDDYEAAIRAITFSSNNENMNTVTRDVSVRVNDGDVNSNTAHAFTSIIVINDSPTPALASGGNGTVTSSAGTPVPIVAVNPHYTSLNDLETFTVGDLTGQLTTNDVEQTSFGIGVTLADETDGTWEYRRTDIPGHTWTTFDAADPTNVDGEPVPNGQVILFGPNTEFRFVPDSGFTGDARFEFRVWDMSTGIASNPVSTTPDNSGGTPPLASSSLSAASFATASGADADGDGVVNSTDIDDDNDGILDTVEEGNAITGASSGTFGTGTATFGPPLPAGFTDYPYNAGPSFGGQYSVIVNTDDVDYEAFGADVFRTVQDRTDPGNGYFAYFDMGIADRGTAMFTQTLNLDPNTTYEISFWLAGPYHFTTPPDSTGIVGISIDGTVVDTAVVQDDTDWVKYIYTFTSNATGVVDFALINNSIGGGQGSDVALDDIVVTRILDSDGDGIRNSLDIDSDNDGITDNVEAQTTTGYIAPSGTGAAMVDANGDGLDDNYDAGTLGATGGIGLTPINTDGADEADYVDADSDNDGLTDAAERGTAGPTTAATGLSSATTDADGDGLFDVFEGASTIDGFDVNDENLTGTTFSLTDTDNDTAANGAGAIPLFNDLDYRDNNEPPVADNETVTAVAGQVTNITVLVGDTDPDSDPLTITGLIDPANPSVTIPLTLGTPVTLASGTTVTLKPNGTLDVVMAPGSSSSEAFQYVISDGHNQTANGTVTLNRDTDGDGVSNADDIDDDNDGIIDVNEGLMSLGPVTGEWSSNNFVAGAHLGGQNSTYISSVSPAAFGSGVVASTGGAGVVPGDTVGGGATQTTMVLSGVSGTTLADAVTDGNYVEFQFTTAPGLSAPTYLDSIRYAEHLFVGTSNRMGGNYDYAVAISSDGFTTSTLVGASRTSGLAGPDSSDSPTFTFNGADFSFYKGELNPYELAAGTSYTVRLYVFNEQDGDGQVVVDDVSFGFASTTDTDADGIADHLDIDSDNDGITDNVEAQSTAGYIAPSGTGALMGDADDDGLDDVYDATSTGGAAGSVGLTPVNTDGTDQVDYLDADSDNDGLTDAAERGTAGPTTAATGLSSAATDADGDGLFDVFEGASTTDGFDVNDENLTGTTFNLADVDNDTAANGAGAVPLVNDLDYRDSNEPPVANDDALTTNEDTPLTTNIITANGIDSDPDGDPLAVQSATVDTDGDGVADPLTLGAPTIITGPGSVAIGTLTLAADGTLTFVPAPNYTGPVPQLNYVLTDGNNQTDPAVVTISITPVNDPPVDDNETATTTEDTPLSVPAATGLLANSTDVDGGTPTITGFSVAGVPGTPVVGTPFNIPGVGDITVNADGSYTFAPAADFNGPVPQITYTVDDGAGGTDTSTLDLSVTPVNDPPVDDNETATTAEDTPLSVPAATGLLANSTDVDGGTPTITGFSVAGVPGTPVVGTPFNIPGVGDITVNADGSYTFAPAADFNGPVPQITYTVDDGAVGTDTSTLDLTITPVSDAPLATDDGPVSVTEDTPATGNVLPNDTDVDGDTLSVTDFTIAGVPGTFAAGDTATIPGVGTLTIAADGSYIFTPEPNYNGPIPTATYTITDGNGGTDKADLTFADIVDVNDAPVAADDGPVTVTEDTPATGNVLPNDTDVDGDTLSVTELTVAGVPGTFNAGDTATIPGVGTLTIAADGSYTFTPELNYAGPVPTATYTITDGTATDTADLSFADITPVNDAPVAVDDTSSGDEDTVQTGNVLQNDTDAENDLLTVSQFTIVGDPTVYNPGDTATLPGVGTLLVNADGSFTFEPETNYNGPVPLVGYTITDGNGGSDVGQLAITINPVNDAPVVVDPNDPGDPNNPTEAPDPDNIIPGITTGDGETPATLDVASFFVDPEGDTLTFTATGLPSGLTMNPDGTITGTINPDASQGGPNADGVYEVVVTADDGNGGITTTTITYTVTNSPPVASDDAKTVTEDVPATGNVLTDGTPDVDGGLDSDTLTVTQFVIDGVTYAAGTTASLPGIGDLVINADGSYTFTPSPNYDGPVPVATYTISDGNGGADEATLTLTITPVNDAPVVVDPANPGDPLNPTPATDPNNIIPDVATADGETPATLDVAPFFVDPEGDPLTFTATGLPPGLTMNPDGTIRGTIDPSASQTSTIGQPPGTYLVTVTADDGNGGITTTAVTYTVTNPPPVAPDDAKTVTEDVPATGNVLADGTPDVDGGLDSDTLTVTQFVIDGTTYPAGTTANLLGVGDLVINADGSYTFTPAPNYDGPLPVATYTISDGQGGTDEATLTLTITPVNDAPVVVDPANPGDPLNPTPATDPNNIIPDVTTADGETPTTLDVAPFFVDPEGDPLTFTATGLPAGLTMNPDGTITGTIDPAASQGGPNADGVYEVVVTADDGNGGITTTTITYSVTNPPPVASDDAKTVTEDVPATGNFITDGTPDVDGGLDSDALIVTQFVIDGVTYPVGTTASLPGVGDLVINADGSYTFTPASNYDGPVPVATYTIADGQGATDTADLVLTITPVNDVPVVVDPDNPGDPLNPTPATDPNNIIPDVTTVDGATPPTLNVAPFFVDPEGDPLTFTATGLPPGLIMNPDGTITGTIDPSASQGGSNSDGVYEVVVTADDGNGGVTTTTITYTITNPPPVALNDTDTVGEDGADVTGNVITDAATGDSDTAPDSDPLTVTLADQAGNPIIIGTPFTTAGGGVLTLNADGSYTFVPGTAYNGLDEGETATEVITYTIDDGQGGTATATLTITIEGANDPVVIIDPNNPGDPDNPTPAPDPDNIIPDISTTDGGVPADPNLAQYFVDPDGDPVTLTVTGLPPGLTFNPATGTITGTIAPDASIGGPNGDGVYTVAVTVDDGSGNPVTTTITYTVTNLPPVAADDAAAVGEDTTNVVGNVITSPTTGDTDTAPDSDPLTVTLANQAGTPITIGVPFTTAGGGVLTLNADGSYTFVPGRAYNGLDVGETATEVITYTVDDGNGGTDTATLTITVNGANDTPVVVNPNNPGNPTNPTLALDPNNIIPDVKTTDGATPPTLDLAPYFVDPDGEPLTITAVGLPPGLTLNPDGTITGTLPPNASQGGPNSDGVYQVTVTVTDPDGASTTTTITYTVTNPPPIAVNDTSSANEDVVQSGNVLPNDSDTGPDSDTLIVTGVNGGTVGQPVQLTHGTLVLNANGTWTFTPNATANALSIGETATETVTYTISDGNGSTATATLEIELVGTNDAPIAGNLPGQSDYDGDVISVDITSGFTDPDGDDLDFTASGLPPGLTIDPETGLITGTIAPGASNGGPYTVTVTASDGNGGTITLTFEWEVLALPVSSEDPVDPTPSIKPPGPVQPVPAIRPVVMDAVNSLISLNGTPDLTDWPVSRAVEGLNSLNSSPALEDGDHVITKIVEWLERQGRDAAWLQDVFDNYDVGPYVGDSLDLALSNEGHELYRVKTVIVDGALFIGVDTLVGGAEVNRIYCTGRGGLPRNAAQIDSQNIVVNIVGAQEWLDLTIHGHLPDGTMADWNISINTQSGEVIAGREPAHSGKALRSALLETAHKMQVALNKKASTLKREMTG